MADNQSTDRIAFGHWLSGFTDGEGCFALFWNRKGKRSPIGKSAFRISLRNDDREILTHIQLFLNCGYIYYKPSTKDKEQPIATFVVANTDDLVRFVIPHFVEFPLRAKKARDFVLWRNGVELIHAIKKQARKGRGGHGLSIKWTALICDEFQAIHDDLKAVRVYDSPGQPPIIPAQKARLIQQGYLFECSHDGGHWDQTDPKH